MKCFLDTLIQKIFFQIMKITIFRGEVTDISAIKEALAQCSAASASEAPVLPFQPKYRFGHPEDNLFSLSKIYL